MHLLRHCLSMRAKTWYGSHGYLSLIRVGGLQRLSSAGLETEGEETQAVRTFVKIVVGAAVLGVLLLLAYATGAYD